MKRSLFITIVVLLMAALFVSCNAEKSLEDQLVEVRIVADESRALSAVGEFDTTTETVANLVWYYTAVKTKGYYRTGERTTLTPVQDEKGIAGATLGDEVNGAIVMSAGGWDFCFYGYIEGTVPAANPRDNAVYYQEGLHKTITGSSFQLEVSLTRGNGGQVNPIAEVENDELFWIDSLGGITGDMILRISKDSVALKEYLTTVSGGKATFTVTDEFALTAGVNNELLFEVFNRYTDDGNTIEEKLGSSLLTIAATTGMRYTITSDTIGISATPEQPVVVTIGAIEVPVVATNAVESYTSTENPTTLSRVVTANTPAATNESTTVEFPIDLTGKQVRVETSSAEVASAKAFTVSADSAVVGSISLSISDGRTTFDNGKAIVSTFIGKGLSGVEVHYNGAASEDIEQADVDYDPESGYVTFATPHFSEFYVTAKGEAKIGSKVYNTLVEAIADAQNGATITLLQNVATATQIEIAGKTIALDLNGKSITYSGTANLSSGVILVHNGASLTINDSSTGATGAVISGEKAYAAVAVTKAGDDSSVPATLVINNGTFTGYYYAVVGNGSRHNTAITINGGDLEGVNGSAIYHPQDGTLIITGGTLTGYETAVEIRAGNVTIDGGTFTSTDTTSTTSTSNGSGTTTSGAAIAVAQHTTKLPINVTINGGSFSGRMALLCSNPENNSAEDIAKVNVTINGGQFSSTDCALCVYKGLSLTINDAIVSAQEACVLLQYAGKVLINGGTFTSIDNFVVGTNGSAGRGGNEITINGGTFNGGITSAGYVACGVYLANADTLTVNGGTFSITNGCGILARSGSAVIGSDVVINVSGDSVGKVGDSAVVVPCKELVLDLRANYPGGVPTITEETEYAVYSIEEQ